VAAPEDADRADQPQTARRRLRREAARRARFRRRRLLAALIAVVLLALLLFLAIRGCGEEDAAPPPPSAAEVAAATAAQLEPAQLAGQRLIAGWDGSEPPRELRRMIRRGEIAGVILFEDNVAGAGATRRTIEQLQALPRPEGLEAPLLVMTDQEGGQVKRLEGPPEADAETIGRRGGWQASEHGRRTAENLLAHGINTDLAPVLDVPRRDGAIDREDRGFGTDPEQVVDAGVHGFAAGLREGGVIATAKHFPGIGAAAENTDFAAVRIPIPADELARTDLPPFEEFVATGGEMVMLSFGVYPSLSPHPAAFAPEIVGGELRERLGFEGVAITDALEAEAAQAFGDPDQVAVAAAEAGNDLLLYSDWRDAEAARAALQRAAGNRLDPAGAQASVARVLELRAGLTG
jgi:beta-N-acetylhexosaminidase